MPGKTGPWEGQGVVWGLHSECGGCEISSLESLFLGTSLVAQWLRLHAPDAGAWVPSLVRELDPTCMPQLRVHAITKEPACHN